ncbi:MAG: sterol desaturase family protein [Xanthomonadales bacterium]|nr:sterol desaturase family protein [Xanthomonadales bacterium]
MLIEFGTAFYVSMFAAIVGAFWLSAWFPLDDAPPGYVHMLRNFTIWLCGFALADYVVADYWLGLPQLLLEQPPGLLYWMGVENVWVLAAIGIFAVDLSDYVYHRMSHHFPWLWRLHAVHHTDRVLDISTSLRGHPLDLVLANFWKIGVAILLGVPIWVIALREVLIFPLIFIQHANVRLPRRFEVAVGKVFITPMIHRVHHSIHREEHDSNYGESLILWDKLFGSYRHPESDRPAVYGVRDCEGDDFQSLDGMLLTPFRMRSR